MNKNRRVIALGFFDGVHNGHGALLRRVVDKARELDAVAAAFTFDRSPTAAITGQTVPLLSSVEDRGWLMRSRYGIQEVVVSNFDGMMRMDWEDFVDRYLAEELGAVHVVAGHDFHFGYMGKGNPRRLQEKCAQLGIGCDIIPKVEQDGITISSTYIRTLIAQGEMERANSFLGHPHVLTDTPIRPSGKIGEQDYCLLLWAEFFQRIREVFIRHADRLSGGIEYGFPLRHVLPVRKAFKFAPSEVAEQHLAVASPFALP